MRCNKKLDGVFNSVRKMSVAGTFYSNLSEEIKKQFLYFNKILEKHNYKYTLKKEAKAIIVPHAGFVYSGFTANIAYRLLKNIKEKRVLVIGPSHKHNFKGSSISLFDKYETPLGNINIDKSYALYLKNKYDFITFNANVHNEHSTETQAPFIKYYLPNTKIVELVYSNISYEQLSLLVNDAINDIDTFVIISTDLSHFYNLKKANSLDNTCLEAVDKLDINIWNKVCEACGRVGVKALIKVANKLSLKSNILDYRTSYDITKDKNSVVGYMSAVIT